MAQIGLSDVLQVRRGWIVMRLAVVRAVIIEAYPATAAGLGMGGDLVGREAEVSAGIDVVTVLEMGDDGGPGELAGGL